MFICFSCLWLQAFQHLTLHINFLAYSIGRYPSSSIRHLVRRQHFQTTSPLKPWSIFLPYFTYSIYKQGEQKKLFFCPNRIRTLVAMATYTCHWLIMGKNENWNLLLSHCRYFDRNFTELFLEWSSTSYMNFVQISEFDWLPWQPKR